jgi:hypothetical protein
VTPHKDVASGRYQQAEFAADLWQVHLGEGTDEYRLSLLPSGEPAAGGKTTTLSPRPGGTNGERGGQVNPIGGGTKSAYDPGSVSAAKRRSANRAQRHQPQQRPWRREPPRA